MAINYGSAPGTYSDAFGKQLHDQGVAEYAKLIDDHNQMVADANARYGTNTPFLDYGTPGWKPKPYNPTSQPYNTGSSRRIWRPTSIDATAQIQTPSTIQPPATKSPAVNTSNLTQAYQNQATTSTSPAIQLPQQFQQNFNATPSITPPGSPQAIKMPNFNRNAGVGTNWSDLFSVANNRYTR